MEDKKPVQIFLESTSVKGLPKIAKSRHLYQKGLWLLGFVVGLSMGTYLVSQLVTEYFEYQTTITSYTRYQTPKLPDITVCKLQVGTEPEGLTPSFDEYLETISNIFKESYESALKDANNVTSTQPPSGINFKDHEILFGLLDKIGYYQNVKTNLDNRDKLMDQLLIIFYFNLWDFAWRTPIIEQLRSQGVHFNTWNLPFLEYLNKEAPDAVKTLYNARYGPCFKFSIASTLLSNLTEGAGTIIYLDSSKLHSNVHALFPNNVFDTESAGLRVILHEPGTIPDMTKGINVAPGFETTLKVSASQRTRLGPPYGSCTKKEKMKYNYTYSVYACKSLCHQDAVKKTCGCLDGKYMTIDEDLKDVEFCGKIFPDNVSLTLDRMRCAMTLEVEDCHCPEKCDEYQYDFTVNQVPWPDQDYILPFYYGVIQKGEELRDKFWYYEHIHSQMIEARHNGNISEYEVWLEHLRTLLRRSFVNFKAVFEKPEILVIADKQKMTIESILATMGATLNLWIGITFLTFIEFMELLFNTFATRTAKKQKRQVQTVHPHEQGKKTTDT